MYEKIIEFGIIVLLIYTPLAFGGVTQRSITLIEIVSGLLLIVWLTKLVSQYKKKYALWSSRRHNAASRRDHKDKPRTRLISASFVGALLLFVFLILLQFFPLPGFLVKLFSPATYRVYAEGALHIGTRLPNLLPLSVCTQATEMELYKFLAYVAIFFLTLNTIRTRNQVNRLVYIIIVVGFLDALYGLIQFVSGQHLIYSYKMKSPWVHGTFVNKNHFAGYMEMVIPLTFGMLFTRFEKHRSPPFKSIEQAFEEKYMKVFFMLFVVFILICAHILSGSRGGMISFCFGMLLLVFLVSIRHLLRRWSVVILIFLPVTLGIITITNPALIDKRLNTLKDMQSSKSFRMRWELWRGAVHIFQDYPVFGSGLGTYSHLARRYKTFRWNYRFNYPENDYLQLLSETGIIGTTLLLGMGGILFYRILAAWKQRSSRWAVSIGAGGLSALFSILIHSAMDFNLHIPSNALLFSVIAALSYNTVQTQKAENRRRKVKSRSSEVHSSQYSVSSNQYSVSSNQYSVSSNQYTAPRTSHLVPRTSYPAPRFRHFTRSLIILGFVLVFVYLFWVTKSYYAFTQYQPIAELVSQKNPPLDAEHYELLPRRLKTAIQHDGNNAEYVFALGSYVYRYYADTQDPEAIARRSQGFQEAEEWLHKAILLDPANPWYYYEKGLLSYSRGDCNDWKQTHPTESWEDCPVTQYFLTALHNAPKNPFLRKSVGRWFYNYNQETAVRLIQEILAGDEEHSLVSPSIARNFSRFLYNIQMDYESDREARYIAPTEKRESEQCETSNVLRRSPHNREVELGCDDGSAEWRTRLVSQTERVKKVICLPENLDEYNDAALKIFMNSDGNSSFTVRIGIDDHLIKQVQQTIPRVRNWHEIPFDKSLLRGKSTIHVYIRVVGASKTENYLEIWGDQDTPTMQSIFNFNTQDDLSSEQGVQTGEYMIRLVLRKL